MNMIGNLKNALRPLEPWIPLRTPRLSWSRSLGTLKQLGFASIGCEPCTRPVAPGEDPRAGRWAGFAKTECGLHR